MTAPGAMTAAAPRDLALSLVSHTNAGKTTLARTLLRRDVGEVRDAPHVTEFADAHALIETAGRERLVLWDTPGFGDSARLLRRLRHASDPIGWFLSQVWDRWRDRPFWSSQQALRHLRAQADVMLYLVNAAEAPEAAGYVEPEMEILAWLGKPVVVLLNQLGAPRAPAVEDAELARWRAHLERWPLVRAVLPLDAFARCWVQEFVLLRAIEDVLEGDLQARMARLLAAWRDREVGVFEASMRALAAGLGRAALDAEPLAEGGGLKAALRQAGAALGVARGEARTEAAAQQALSDRLEAGVRDGTLELLRLHGLGGSVEREIRARVATHYRTHLRLDETGAALWGGAITGALSGLGADVMSGGLTFGAGMLAGGVLGALGAAGIARGMNVARGTDRSWVTWSPQALDRLADAALLRYLAVAHFGRGRGDWVHGESPPHWAGVVGAALAPRRAELAQIWAQRPMPGGPPSADVAAAAARCGRVLIDAGRAALVLLYPVAREVFDTPSDART